MRGISYLNGLAPWSGSFSGEWSLDLMRRLMSNLGAPHDDYPSIHVTGTNGKGSVSVAVASILARGGRKVGLTTSPHLKSINERIVINGRPISDELLDRCGAAVMEGAASFDQPPTFFEGITAAAFLAFKLAGVDFAVIEVGLGGRLDATNVLPNPRVCVIATVDLDHESILGATRSDIAREKAGIFKPRAELVVGNLTEDARNEVERAASGVGGRLHISGREFSATPIRPEAGLFTGMGESFEFLSALPGEHQIHNMGVAIAAGLLVGASRSECIEGVKNVRWPGRLENITVGQRQVIIDAAHNPAGIKSLITFLNSRGIRPDCAFGAIETKNWRAMISDLIPHVGGWIVLEPDFPKAVPSRDIAAFLSSFGIKPIDMGRRYTDFATGLPAGDRPMLIAGSIYLIGIIRDLFVSTEQPLW